jgi:hypothetical protein
MEDSRGVIPNEPTQPPNELLHQTSNHVSILLSRALSPADTVRRQNRRPM